MLARDVPSSGQGESLLASFIPRAPAAVAHVDAVEKQGERGGVEPEFAVADIGGAGPGEGAFFKPLGQHPKAAAVPVENFKKGAALVGEGEDGAAAGIFPEPGVTASCRPLKLRRMSQGSTATKTFKLPEKLNMGGLFRFRGQGRRRAGSGRAR